MGLIESVEVFSEIVDDEGGNGTRVTQALFHVSIKIDRTSRDYGIPVVLGSAYEKWLETTVTMPPLDDELTEQSDDIVCPLTVPDHLVAGGSLTSYVLDNVLVEGTTVSPGLLNLFEGFTQT